MSTSLLFNLKISVNQVNPQDQLGLQILHCGLKGAVHKAKDVATFPCQYPRKFLKFEGAHKSPPGLMREKVLCRYFISAKYWGGGGDTTAPQILTALCRDGGTEGARGPNLWQTNQGGRLCPSYYYWHPHIISSSAFPAVGYLTTSFFDSCHKLCHV